MQGLEELRHDQARQVIVRAALHVLHVLHGQLLLAREFSIDLVSPVAVNEGVPGRAELVGVGGVALPGPEEAFEAILEMARDEVDMHMGNALADTVVDGDNRPIGC